MNAQHTPGPWVLEPETFSPRIFVVRANRGPDEQAVASVLDRRDARLIAAAPELLEALETHPGYSGDVSFGEIWKWLAKREAAIAKATGDA